MGKGWSFFLYQLYHLSQMTCEVLGVEYEKKELNIMTGENMTPEFLKINPHHNIPAIKDGNLPNPTSCKSFHRIIYLDCSYKSVN